jgi:omega-6 fatty acid desaturase (delta-12 desaturase)
LHGFSAISPAPAAPPPFTKEELRQAIPAHCFERNLWTSLGYALRDVAMLVALALCAAQIDAHGLPWAATASLWACYWYAAGCVGTGLWMIGHECGHGAFSNYGAVNYVVGSLSHTFCGVPYSAWRITHARHHKHTNSMEDDEPFVPMDFRDVCAKAGLGLLVDSDALRALYVAGHLLLGWPLYLLIDLGGPPKNGGAGHLNPFGGLFEPQQRLEVLVGTALYAGWAAVLARWALARGAAQVIAYYGIPLLIVNAHLVTITYLQHTDAAVPHYREPEFSWLRGALATVDRSWGPLLDVVFHHISNTHVAHHLFHDMPFYHAQEATAALAKKLGRYYLKDDTPISVALWNNFKACKFVGDESVAVWHDNAAFQARLRAPRAKAA